LTWSTRSMVAIFPPLAKTARRSCSISWRWPSGSRQAVEIRAPLFLAAQAQPVEEGGGAAPRAALTFSTLAARVTDGGRCAKPGSWFLGAMRFLGDLPNLRENNPDHRRVSPHRCRPRTTIARSRVHYSVGGLRSGATVVLHRAF